jgi:hypothetical protein
LNLQPVAVGGEVVRGTDLRPPLGSAFSTFQIGRFGDFSYFSNLTNSRGESRPTIMWGPSIGSNQVVVARIGAQAAGLPSGVVYGGLTMTHALGIEDTLGFAATIQGPGVTTENDGVIAISRLGNVSLVREGVALGSLGGRSVNLSSLPALPSVFGGVLFTAAISAQGGGTPQPAIFRAEPVSLVAQQGWAAPGLPGVTFQRFSASPSQGFGGVTAYTAILAGQGVTQLNASSVWLQIGGLVARGGEAVPGLPAGVRHLEFGSPVVYGREGGVMVVSLLVGEGVTPNNNTALFAGSSGALQVVARTGDQAPGTSAGVVIGAFDPIRDRTAAYVNAKGDVVFLNTLRGAGVTTANDGAIFVREAGGPLRLVAREGNTVRVHGTDRVIAEILNAAPNAQGGPWMSNGDDGRRTILNRYGECFFVARFTDGSVALLKAQAAARPCQADFNSDRFIDCFDYLEYVEAFEHGDPTADLTDDEFVDFFDYAEFVALFEAGC